MQKIISFLLLVVCIFLLAKPVNDHMKIQEQVFWKPSQQPAVSVVPVVRMTASELGSSIAASTPSSLYAKAYCVMDTGSGRLLLSKNENEKMPMASTTKIMTCILALESGRLDEMVSVSAYAASMPDVRLNIREGEKYRLGDLLYSLMLESHNDTAVAIAEFLGGSVEGFADQMNKKAEEIGCVSTHFVTPNGLDDPEHYTTAKELCMIAAYAIQNKEFQKVIRTPQYQFRDESGNRSFHVSNHDAFLSMYQGALGIKTGFTGNAGYCFCGAATKNNRTLVSTVLACGWPPHKTYKWSDTTKLMDYGFEGFKTCEIPTDQDTWELPVENGRDRCVTVSMPKEDTDSLQLPLRVDDVIEIRTSLPEKLTAPVRSGDIVGSREILLNGEVITTSPIYTGQDTAAVDFPYVLKHLFRNYVFS